MKFKILLLASLMVVVSAKAQRLTGGGSIWNSGVSSVTVSNVVNGLSNYLWLAIGEKQNGSAALTNLAAAGTNYVATTNGIATQLTNRGGFFTGSLTTTNSTNTTIYASSTITAAGQIMTTAAIMWVPAGYYFGIGNGSVFTAFGQGTSGNYDEVAFYRSDSGLLGMFQFGSGTGAGTPALMVTNGNMFLGNATRTFNSSTTNSTTVAGLRVGFQAFSAVLTNTFTTNVVWDFPSTSVGAVADLGATITGVKDGDTVIIAPPQAAMTGIIGSYSGFASNGVAYGRFLPLAATQDPASATFRVIVHQYR